MILLRPICIFNELQSQQKSILQAELITNCKLDTFRTLKNFTWEILKSKYLNYEIIPDEIFSK